MIQDVSKAYFFAEATRRVFVEIPDEDREPGDENKCALLLRSLYGTRDAALNWAECYTSKLLALGFSKGASSPCTFFHEGRGIRLAVHGDDFVSEAPAADLKWLDVELKKHFTMKSQTLGPDVGECKELTILNRSIRWTSSGVTWEPDPRHAETIIRDMGIEDGKGVCSPGVRESEKRRGKAEAEAKVTDFVALDAAAVVADIAGDCSVSRNYINNLVNNPFNARERLLAQEGWKPVATARGARSRWMKSFPDSVCMVEPPVDGVCRRITRDLTSQRLIEDLWIGRSTPSRLISRELRMPSNIGVQI